MPIKHETDTEYHSSPGVSKTRLWHALNKTPYHARFGAPKESHAFSIGRAAHIAILEPDTFDKRVLRGPADRRGNKWKEAQDHAAHLGAELLTESDYDLAVSIVELASTSPELELLRKGEHMAEVSAYAEDESGLLLKCRPDFYSVTHRMMIDVKCMANASPRKWGDSVADYGYHMQHALYSDVWARGSGHDVDAFFFLVFERHEPPLMVPYELTPSQIAEGHAAYRKAVDLWAECERNDTWPGYASGIQQTQMPRWGYKLTPAPQDMEE